MKLNSIIQSFLIYQNPISFYLTLMGLIKNCREIKLRRGIKFSVHNGKSDLFILEEMFKSKDYDLAISKLNDKSIVIDIGGHIGIFSIMVSRIAKQVIVYEPDPGNLKYLNKNIKSNNVMNVFIKPYAVASKKGSAKLYINNNSAGNSLLKLDNNKSITIKTVRLDDELADINKIDLLKMDCEGGEYNILLNLRDTTIKKLNSIILEYHDNLTQKYNHNDLMNFFVSRGFQIKVIKKESKGTGIMYIYR